MADYILRLIQQIAMMLANIIAQRQRGELAGAAREIEEKCLQATGLPLSLVKQSSPDAVADLLAAAGALRFPRAIMLAELLIQDAELAEERGNPPSAAVSYAHAARLLADSLDVLGSPERAHYQRKLDDVAAKLRDLSNGFPADSQ